MKNWSSYLKCYSKKKNGSKHDLNMCRPRLGLHRCFFVPSCSMVFSQGSVNFSSTHNLKIAYILLKKGRYCVGGGGAEGGGFYFANVPHFLSKKKWRKHGFFYFSCNRTNPKFSDF